jgi:hypothetical protein
MRSSENSSSTSIERGAILGGGAPPGARQMSRVRESKRTKGK